METIKPFIRMKKVVYQPKWRGQYLIDGQFACPVVYVPEHCVSSTRISGYFQLLTEERIRKLREEYLPTAKEEWMNIPIHNKDNAPFRPYGADQDIHVSYNHPPYLSFSINMLLDTGGAHPNTGKCGRTFDIHTGRQVALKELFRSGVDISALLEEEVLRQISPQEDTYFDDVSGNVKKYYDPKNYYLTEEGLAIFFPRYTIAPGYFGEPTFTIPYTALAPYLRRAL